MGNRLVLFDVDGTLIDSAGSGRRALVRAFHFVFGLRDGDSLVREVRFQGKTDPVIAEDIARVAGLLDDGFRANLAELFRIYLRELRADLARADSRRRVLPGVERLLETLHGMGGVHLGLLTGNIEAGARAKLDAFGLNRFFPGGGFGSDHADRREVARVARLKLARALGQSFEPSATVVVGDTEFDVDCARANGFRAVAVDHGWVDRHRLESARPDALLDGFEDLEASLAALSPPSPAQLS